MPAKTECIGCLKPALFKHLSSDLLSEELGFVDLYLSRLIVFKQLASMINATSSVATQVRNVKCKSEVVSSSSFNFSH